MPGRLLRARSIAGRPSCFLQPRLCSRRSRRTVSVRRDPLPLACRFSCTLRRGAPGPRRGAWSLLLLNRLPLQGASRGRRAPTARLPAIWAQSWREERRSGRAARRVRPGQLVGPLGGTGRVSRAQRGHACLRAMTAAVNACSDRASGARKLAASRVVGTPLLKIAPGFQIYKSAAETKPGNQAVGRQGSRSPARFTPVRPPAGGHGVPSAGLLRGARSLERDEPLRRECSESE